MQAGRSSTLTEHNSSLKHLATWFQSTIRTIQPSTNTIHNTTRSTTQPPNHPTPNRPQPPHVSLYPTHIQQRRRQPLRPRSITPNGRPQLLRIPTQHGTAAGPQQCEGNESFWQ